MTMSAAVVDPDGIKLKRMLLQVIDRDERGPRTLCTRHDHETIDLTDVDHRSFIIVWVPETITLGDVSLAQIYNEFQNLKVINAQRELERVELSREIRDVERDIERAQAENKTKTEALRDLQRERDPERLEATLRARVEGRTASYQETLRQAMQKLDEQKREIEELRASKRKLKEANDRLKEKR
jgi:hypothetical protein